MKSVTVRILLLAVGMALAACSRPSQITAHPPQITVRRAGWRDELECGYVEKHQPFDDCRSESGYRFLTVDADINFETPTYLSIEDIAVVSGDGKSYPAVGSTLAFSVPHSPGQYDMSRARVKDLGGKNSNGYVFTIPNEAMNQSFALQYRNMSPISFSIK